MWKVNVFTGQVVDSFPHNGAGIISQRCAIGDYQAGETGLFNNRGWDKSTGSLLWGPLNTTPTLRAKAFILNDYGDYLVAGSVTKYPNTSAQGYVNDNSPEPVDVYDMSDGSEITHSMTGQLIRCGSNYIDTFANPPNAVTPQTATIRRYSDDLTTLITSVTQASVGAGKLQSAALSEASYAVLGTTLKVWEPADLSLRFEVTPLPSGSTGVTDDEQGGVYLYTGSVNDRILKYSTSDTPDWDVTDAAYAIPRFGALGNIYSHNASTPALTKIDGADGSIAWTCDYSSVSGPNAGGFSEVLSTGHSGVVLLSNGSFGLVAIDDVYGSVLWFSANKGYGRPIPDGDSYVWLCGEYGL